MIDLSLSLLHGNGTFRSSYLESSCLNGISCWLLIEFGWLMIMLLMLYLSSYVVNRDAENIHGFPVCKYIMYVPFIIFFKSDILVMPIGCGAYQVLCSIWLFKICSHSFNFNVKQNLRNVSKLLVGLTDILKKYQW